jgi:hypothetical protein
MSCRWRDGDGVRAESIGHRLAAFHPVRRDEAGICRKMSVNESFHLVERNSPAERIKNRKKAKNRSHDSKTHGFIHSSFGRFTWRPLARSQKSEDDVDVRTNPPTVKQNRVGGFRLKACVK